jgi:hypothetical protein
VNPTTISTTLVRPTAKKSSMLSTVTGIHTCGAQEVFDDSELHELKYRLELITDLFMETEPSDARFVWMKVDRGVLNDVENHIKALTIEIEQSLVKTMKKTGQGERVHDFKRMVDVEYKKIEREHEQA